MTRSVLISLVVLYLVFACTAKPNFIVFFVDDWGYGDLGANNPNTYTPNMDKLAQEGMLMSDFHVGASICTVSRAALLTGRIGLRSGVVKNFNPFSVAGLPQNETTFAEVLKTVGYRTAQMGKWHLGTTKGFHPFYRGFDTTYTVPYSLDMGCADQCGDPALNMPRNTEPNICPKDLSEWKQKQSHNMKQGDEAPHPFLANSFPSYFPENKDNNVDDVNDGSPNTYSLAVPLYSNDSIIQQPVNMCELSAGYAQFGIDFIKQNSSQPFLLYYPLSHVHVPHAHAAKWTNVTKNGIFGDTLAEADDTIGQIVAALDESGQRNNTLIFVTGDNGPWEVKCDLAGSVGPFKGLWQKNEGGGGSSMKMTAWEGGHRMATIFNWPGVVPAGTSSDALTSSMDLLPTLARLAGATLPSNREFDGIDIFDIITGKSDQGHDYLFHPNSGSIDPPGALDAVRYGQYKAHFKTGGHAPDCAGNVGPLQTHDPPLLFDLKADPAEANPLDTSKLPYSEVVTQIKNLRTQYLQNIANDNTTTADYTKANWAEPCCNPDHVVCRCTDDTPSGLDLEQHPEGLIWY